MNNNYYSNWLGLTDRDRLDIYSETAAAKGLPVSAIEKDWWVVQTLAMIYTLPFSAQLIFKGGTSLSKGWDLIQRFSEDIDLVLDREFFGFSGGITKSQLQKLRKISYQFISSEFVNVLESAFTKYGFNGVSVKPQATTNHDRDPLTLEIYYPMLTEQNPYLKPGILVEVGSRSLIEPYTYRTFGALVSDIFPDNSFSDQPITVPTVNPERTFLEKIFLLHEEFQKPPNKRRVDRLSRHLYDIEILSRTSFAEKAFKNPDLYQTILHHRSIFTPIAGIDYAALTSDKIRIVPPESILKLWENDYKIMSESMIFGQFLPFDELIKNILELQRKINIAYQ